METFGWIDMDVLPILIPTLSGPAGPRLDLAKRCPSFGITFFRDCFQPIPSQEHYSIEVFDIPSTNGKKEIDDKSPTKLPPKRKEAGRNRQVTSPCLFNGYSALRALLPATVGVAICHLDHLQFGCAPSNLRISAKL